MPRHARCVSIGIAHHVTQRGVDRTNVFHSQQDRKVYLNLVAEHLVSSATRALAWCLMTNHVHWIVVPEREDSLALLFRRVHGRYAQYLNARLGRCGHLWQNRFFSCALAGEREAAAIRYVEWNPLRAGLSKTPEDYRWSSAAAHILGPHVEETPLLDWSYWRERGAAEGWRALLSCGEDVRESAELRRATYAGAPLGPAEFVSGLEQTFGRHWIHSGRPRKRKALSFETGTVPTVTLATG